MSRDTGLSHGAGKGDADRTSDMKKFQENFARIPFNPADRTGFEKTAPGRYRKIYGISREPVKLEAIATPESLMSLARASRAFISGNNSDH